MHLPIQIDDRVRPTLQEVQLWVKETPQAPWTIKEKVPGTQTFFTYRAARDGEYWFNVVTVDRAGRAIPADVSKEPPGLIVVIDSTPPRAEPKVLAVTPEGQQIRCEITDVNPDPSKTHSTTRHVTKSGRRWTSAVSPTPFASPPKPPSVA